MTESEEFYRRANIVQRATAMAIITDTLGDMNNKSLEIRQSLRDAWRQYHGTEPPHSLSVYWMERAQIAIYETLMGYWESATIWRHQVDRTPELGTKARRERDAVLKRTAARKRKERKA